MTAWELAGWGAAGVATMMFALWLIHFPLRNAAIVDCGWGLGIGGLGVFYAFFADGNESRRALLGLMAGVWGLRLSLYLLKTRILGHEEEGRYRELRRKWSTNVELKFLAFYEFQALLCPLMSVPLLLSAINPAPMTWVEWTPVVLWAVSLLGEIAADSQLARFKTRPANRGRTCQVGLWRYSRHPNYFFEWLIWVAFALYALPAPYGFLGLIAPAMILYFLLRVTGIPATEEQALRSRGDEYRRYQQTTSAFIPWFPKAAKGGR